MRYLVEVNKIVRDRWGRVGRGWRVLIVVGVVVAVVVGLVSLVVWLLGRVIKGLTTGGVRNLDLYYPARRRSG